MQRGLLSPGNRRVPLRPPTPEPNRRNQMHPMPHESHLRPKERQRGPSGEGTRDHDPSPSHTRALDPRVSAQFGTVSGDALIPMKAVWRAGPHLGSCSPPDPHP